MGSVDRVSLSEFCAVLMAMFDGLCLAIDDPSFPWVQGFFFEYKR